MKILINSHTTPLKGPIHFLEDYLVKKGNTVIHLSHPLENYSENSTREYLDGNLVRKIERNPKGLINITEDAIMSTKFILSNKYELFIGANNFDVAVGIFWNKMLRRKVKNIYFAADFSEKRFESGMLNKIYFYVENYSLRKSDWVVSNTKRAEKKRLKMGLPKNKSIVIPNGVYLKNPKFKYKKLRRYKFVYIGNVTYEHGILKFIKEIKNLIGEIYIIGQGDQWIELKKLLLNLNIKNKLYYRKDHDFVIHFLQEFDGFGLAPYRKYSWTWFASPLKINEYISCGVPVIMSDVVEQADYIKRKGYGIVYKDLSYDEIKPKLMKFNIKDYQIKSKKYYKNFNYTALYSKFPV